MAQLVLRLFYLKYALFIDFGICAIGISIHQFLDINASIDYEKRKYDTIFFLTCLVLVTRIIANVGVLRDKRILENESKKLDNEKKKLENEAISLENEKIRRELNL